MKKYFYVPLLTHAENQYVAKGVKEQDTNESLSTSNILGVSLNA